MKRAFFYITLALFSLGCSDTNHLPFSTETNLQLNVSANQPINYGIPFEFTLIDIEDSTDVSTLFHLSGNEFVRDSSFLTLNTQPTQPNCKRFPISFYYSYKEDSIILHDTIDLNYRGDLHILGIRSAIQPQPTKPKKSGVTLFNPNGIEGKPGITGQDGEQGLICTGHLWKLKDTLFLHIARDTDTLKWLYKSSSCDSIYINLSGGDGQHGGDGGDGGDGKPGSKKRSPGNGGNGGIGGNGGNGGNGGSILLFVHPNAEYLIPFIRVDIQAGKQGQGGNGGVGGLPGKAQKYQNTAEAGLEGKPGLSGIDGKTGLQPVISIVPFDYTIFYE